MSARSAQHSARLEEMEALIAMAKEMKKAKERWSQRVLDQSDALDLEVGVFKLKDPKDIALSLKRSAEHSHRRKSDPYRSAMSMLNFYINRSGKNLSDADRHRLERAKNELRKVFHRAD